MDFRSTGNILNDLPRILDELCSILDDLSTVPIGHQRRRRFILQRDQWHRLLDAYTPFLREINRNMDDLLVKTLQGPLKALLLALQSAYKSLTECIAPHIQEFTASNGDGNVWNTDLEEILLLTEEQHSDLQLWLLQKGLKHALSNEVQHLHTDNLRTCSIAVIEAADISLDLPPVDIEPYQSTDLVTLLEEILHQGASKKITYASSTSTSNTSKKITYASSTATSNTAAACSNKMVDSLLTVAQFVLDRISLTSVTKTTSEEEAPTSSSMIMERLKVESVEVERVEVAPTQFSDIIDEHGEKKRLGKGSCGTVFEKKWMLDNHHVAVKVLEVEMEASDVGVKVQESLASPSDAHGDVVVKVQEASASTSDAASSSSSSFKKLLNEVCGRELTTQVRLSHPNLLPLLCYTQECKKDDSNSYMVIGLATELMVCNLHNLIQNTEKASTRAPFPLHVAVDIMLQIAKGMEYLHLEKIMHRDLKPANILVSPDIDDDHMWMVRVKIADFDSSKVIEHNRSGPQLHTANVGTDIWRAPEVLDIHYSQDKKSYDQKADVYSFGMVCYQIITRKVPFEGDESKNQGDERESLRYRIQKEHYRPTFSDEVSSSCPEALIHTIISCWHQVPSERPNFNEIVAILRFMKVYALGLLVGYEESNQPDHKDPLVALVSSWNPPPKTLTLPELLDLLDHKQQLSKTKGISDSASIEELRQHITSVDVLLQGIPAPTKKKMQGGEMMMVRDAFLPNLTRVLQGVSQARMMRWATMGCALLAWASDARCYIAQQNCGDSLDTVVSRIQSLLRSMNDAMSRESQHPSESAHTNNTEIESTLYRVVYLAFKAVVLCDSCGLPCRYFKSSLLEEMVIHLSEEIKYTERQISSIQCSKPTPSNTQPPNIKDIDEQIVGRDNEKKDALQFLRANYGSGVRAICLHGIGKSTLGQAIFQELQSPRSNNLNINGQPYICCREELKLDVEYEDLPKYQKAIIENITKQSEFPNISNTLDGRNHLIKELQNIQKPILLYIDNLVKKKHMKELLPKSRSLPQGLRILVTTRDKAVAESVKRDLEISDLNYKQIELK